jgi:hypothetical protein
MDGTPYPLPNEFTHWPAFYKNCSGFAMPENPVRALTGAN